MQTHKTAISLNEVREDSRSILVEAYTDRYYTSGHAQPNITPWVINKPASPPFSGEVIALHFNEETNYITIDLSDGSSILKHNPSTLIYKPYAEARELYNFE